MNASLGSEKHLSTCPNPTDIGIKKSTKKSKFSSFGRYLEASSTQFEQSLTAGFKF